jgi:hypothetical protein
MRRKNYLAFMLRLWQDQNEGSAVWRASLESPLSGERRGFVSLEALFDFLRQHAEQNTESAQGKPLSEEQD